MTELTDYELQSLTELQNSVSQLQELNTTMLAIFQWFNVALLITGIIISFILARWFIKSYVLGTVRAFFKFKI